MQMFWTYALQTPIYVEAK